LRRRRGDGKKISRLAKWLGLPHAELTRMLNDDYAGVVRRAKRVEKNAAVIERARELGFTLPSRRRN
jgi:hypothetical protein